MTEMKAQDNVWENITMVTTSDFGRTLSSNGAGTDHAWAGNHILLGGSILGGQVLNKYPQSLLPKSDQDAGRGRLIPNYPWESFMVPIATWMGVQGNEFLSVFPNLPNFNVSTHIVPYNVLFSVPLPPTSAPSFAPTSSPTAANVCCAFHIFSFQTCSLFQLPRFR